MKNRSLCEVFDKIFNVFLITWTKWKFYLFPKLQQKIEIQQKSYQTLEVKFNRSHSDMTSSHNALEELKTEYESYKVRAHNVLKQQKENSSNALVEKHDAEVWVIF